MTTDPRVEELQLQLRRMEHEKSSHASRAERYRDILDQLPLAICRLHTDGVLGFANRACCDVLGQPIEDMIGRNFLALCDATQRSNCETSWRRLCEDMPQVQVPATAPGGTHWTFHAILEADGSLIAMQAVGHAAAVTPSRQQIDTRPTTANVPEIEPATQSTILVVDDEDMVCTLAQKVLEKFGFKVLKAQTGRDALDIFRLHRLSISVVLLDMSLPDIDGKRVFTELRQLSPQIPVIISSGYDSVSHQRFNREDVSFLPKPYMPDQLISVVRDLLPSGD